MAISDEYSPDGIPTEPDTWRRGTAELPTAPGGWTPEEHRPTKVLNPGGWHYNGWYAHAVGGDINHHIFGTSAMVAANLAGANVPGETLEMLENFLRIHQWDIEEGGGYWVGKFGYWGPMISIGVERPGTMGPAFSAGQFWAHPPITRELNNMSPMKEATVFSAAGTYGGCRTSCPVFITCEGIRIG